MGGSQYQAKLLIEELHKQYNTSIAYFTARAPANRDFSDHTVIGVGRDNSLRKFGHFWDYFKLQKALGEFRPDVIYQRVSCSYTGIAARYSIRSGVPMVWHIASDKDCRKPIGIRNSFRRPHAWLESRLAKGGITRAEIVVAQTEDQVRLLEENFGRRADRLIRNFHPESRLVQKNSDVLTVVWVANFKQLKRPELFLEIAFDLRDVPGIEFLMVGQPYSSEKVQARFEKKMRQVPNVKCLGAMSQEGVNALLDSAHVIVNTSKWEGFSNTFIQAWMRGVPVLTLGINPDQLLDDEKIGRCLNSTSEISRSIRELAANPDMLEIMGQHARQFATSHFSMRNATELAELIVETARK